MRFRTLMLSCALAGVVTVAGCSGGPDAPPAPSGETTQTGAVGPDVSEEGATSAPSEPTTRTPAPDGAAASSSPAPDVELGEPYPAPDGLTRPEPEPIASVTSAETGHTFDLTGVHRLADDWVVVAGLLRLEQDPDGFAPAQWDEPGHSDYPQAEGFQFAPFRLTVEGDQATYLPVRTEDDDCLCSVVRPNFVDVPGPNVVMTVMSAPAGASTVTVEMPGYGEMTDVPVTDVPVTDTTPWGNSEVMIVRSAERAGGNVTVRVAIGTPADREAGGTGQGAFNFGHRHQCFAGLTVTGGTSRTGVAPDDPCNFRNLPPAGELEEAELVIPDPGTEQIVLLPWNGHPMAIEVPGEAQEGSGDFLVDYASRVETSGATVDRGDEVSVSLDTSVLFEFDESELTAEAEDALAVAVETLQAQEGRSLTIDGHTDSQGEAVYNQELSLARAEAVRDALESALGQGWTFTVNGYGEEQLAAKETGTPEQVEAAQARNRRVELSIDQ